MRPADKAPVMRLVRMAQQMARAVCRGLLDYPRADAALICSTLRAEREGVLQISAGEMIRRLRGILKDRIEAEEVRRDVAIHHVKRAVKPLIAAHREWPALCAMAHDSNGADGFVLTEDEATDAMCEAVYWSLPTPQTQRRWRPGHG